MLVVILRLRQLRFGLRPAFIRREHCNAPDHLADTFIPERPSGGLCNTAHRIPLNLWRRARRSINARSQSRSRLRSPAFASSMISWRLFRQPDRTDLQAAERHMSFFECEHHDGVRPQSARRSRQNSNRNARGPSFACGREQLGARRRCRNRDDTAMPTGREYRQRAEDCVKLAKETIDLYARMALLERAAEFRARAQQLEFRERRDRQRFSAPPPSKFAARY